MVYSSLVLGGSWTQCAGRFVSVICAAVRFSRRSAWAYSIVPRMRQHEPRRSRQHGILLSSLAHSEHYTRCILSILRASVHGRHTRNPRSVWPQGPPRPGADARRCGGCHGHNASRHSMGCPLGCLFVFNRPASSILSVSPCIHPLLFWVRSGSVGCVPRSSLPSPRVSRPGASPSAALLVCRIHRVGARSRGVCHAYVPPACRPPREN